jgi:hypothetical protein
MWMADCSGTIKNSNRKNYCRVDMTAEEQRLAHDLERTTYWKRWGPYLSERQWGTVREDYSATGDAWQYFSHDQARSALLYRR